MSLRELDDRLKKFKQPPRVCVLGDVMLDVEILGEMGSPCPERPDLHRFCQESRLSRPGGAGNLAVNLATLGARTSFISVAGNDRVADELFHCLQLSNLRTILLRDLKRKTTLKQRHRLKKDGKLLFRLDCEDPVPIDRSLAVSVVNEIQKSGPHDLIAISDYGKGFVTKDLIDCLPKDIPICVDPKRPDYGFYGQCVFIKPNTDEAVMAAGMPAGSVYTDEAAARIYCNAEWLIVTRGSLGVVAYKKGDNPSQIIRAKVNPQIAGDATGCGDSVMAVLSYFFASGGKESHQSAPDVRLAICAAACAGAVCHRHTGVFAPTWERIREEVATSKG